MAAHTGGSAAGDSPAAGERAAFRAPFLALALAAGVAGILDAFALTRYGVFVANQSGNVVHVGMGLVGHDPSWPASVASMAGFATGAGVAFRLRGRGGPDHRSPAAVELCMTIGALLLWAGIDVALDRGPVAGVRWVVLVVIGGFSMGCMSALMVRSAGTAVNATYQSGTVAKTGERIAAWITGTGPARTGARHASLLGSIGIAGYATGGGVGALTQRHPVWTFAVAVSILCMLLLSLTARRPQPGTRRAGPG
ncbi:DUF1275 domain-containing protein [Dactylosporangium sp. NBC_01737]|uniref:YoaK family protein n=1 Tax=Dactylosporangium sp. NBC_01737 TaxID=2975959 RepID=UPI002E140E14|nr:DUF1275 domain-containing protein [Dactylosporangium sp. NBC_01737]